MQTVYWMGQGEGTTSSPYIINVDEGFDIQQPFNVLISNNYIDAQKPINYFKFDNSPTIYVLGYLITNRDSMMYIETTDAIKVTMFLTDKTDYLDGPYIVTSYGGLQFIVKQQVFDPNQKLGDGAYRGLWVSGQSYNVNDTIVYNGFLYICMVANHDEIFIAANWENLSGSKILIRTRDPLESDFNYDLGTLWVNTIAKTHYVLVGNTNSIGVWNLGSMKPDNETLSLNDNSQIQIKDKTIEGGEW